MTSDSAGLVRVGRPWGDPSLFNPTPTDCAERSPPKNAPRRLTAALRSNTDFGVPSSCRASTTMFFHTKTQASIGRPHARELPIFCENMTAPPNRCAPSNRRYSTRTVRQSSKAAITVYGLYPIVVAVGKILGCYRIVGSRVFCCRSSKSSSNWELRHNVAMR